MKFQFRLGKNEVSNLEGLVNLKPWPMPVRLRTKNMKIILLINMYDVECLSDSDVCVILNVNFTEEAAAQIAWCRLAISLDYQVPLSLFRINIF